MKKIKHITQPTKNSCVSACIAMITEQNVNDVIKEFHEDLQNHRVKVNEYLAAKGVLAIPLLSTYTTMLPDRLYLVAVPSLNIIGGTHMIIMDLRDEFIELYDPNFGREGRFYYVYGKPSDGSIAVELNSFSPEFEVIL